MKSVSIILLIGIEMVGVCHSNTFSAVIQAKLARIDRFQIHVALVRIHCTPQDTDFIIHSNILHLIAECYSFYHWFNEN